MTSLRRSGGSGDCGGGGSRSGGGRPSSRCGAVRWGVYGGGQLRLQQRQHDSLTPQQLREWYISRGGGGGKFEDAAELPRWLELVRQGVDIFALDYDDILTAMYALSTSAEGDCYRCVPPDPGIMAAALGPSASGTPPGTAPAEALHTFTLADPSGGPIVARSSTVLPCPAVPSCSLSGLHLSSFSTNLVSTAALQDAMVTTTTPGGQVAASCSCRLLSHQTLLWHHSLGHPSLPRLHGMHSCLLVSGLPRSLPPLPPSPAPPCLPCVEGRQRATPHSSSFPPTTAPLHTLHMDVWGPAHVNGQGRERYFLLVVDVYTRYTTVFPLRSKGEVSDVLIPWMRTVRLQLHERFGQDLPVLHLQSDRGGEFLPTSYATSRRIDLVMEVARTSIIHVVAPHFLWPFAVRYAAHQLNLWPRVSLPETLPTLRWTGEVGDASVFRVWGYRAFVRDTSVYKLSARAIPCVFLGFVPDAPGWQFYHPTLPSVFPSQDIMFDEPFPFYRLFPYRSAPPLPPPLFLAPGPPLVDPLPPQGLPPSGVSQVDPLSGTMPLQVAVGSGAAPGAASGGAEPGGAESEGAGSGGAGPGGEEPRGAEPAGVETGGVEPGGAESEGAESGGAEPRGAASSGGPAGASPQLSPQQLREWFARRPHLRSGATGAGDIGDARAGGAGVTAGAGGAGAAATGPGGARTRGSGAARSGGVEGAGAGDPTELGATRAGGCGAGGAGAAGARAVDPGAGGGGDIVRPRPWPLHCLLPLLTLSSPANTECREPASRPVSPVCTAPRVPRSRPPPVPGTHAMALRPSSVRLHVPLRAPRESSLPESAAASALVAELLDFTAACRLDYATALLAKSESASPPSVGGECALGTDVLEGILQSFTLPASPQQNGIAERHIFCGRLQSVLPPHSRRVFPSQDVTFDESVPFYHLFPYRSAPPPPPPLFLALGPPPVDPLPGTVPVEVAVNSGAARGAASGGAASGLVSELVDFAAACRLNYATPLVAESSSASPPSVGGECALSTNVHEDRHEDLECLAAAVPHFASMLLAPEGDPDAPDIPSPRSYAEAITGPYSSQWQTAMDAEMASWKSTGTCVCREGAGDPAEPGAGDIGTVGAGAGGPGAGGAGAGGAGAGDSGAVVRRAGGARAGGAVSGGTGSRGTVQLRPYFIPMLQQPASALPAPSPYTEQTEGLTEHCEPVSRPASPVPAVCTSRRVPRAHPPLVPGTHAMALRPSSVPLRVPLPPPPASSLPVILDPESDLARAASPAVSRLLATIVTDPSFESTVASALVYELVDFAAACRLDYATALVAESESANPPSVGGECALGTDVLEDSHGRRDGILEMTTLRVLLHVAAQRDYKLHSLEFSTTFLQGSLHEEIWLRRPPGFTGTFPAGTQSSLRRPVYGLRQAPREWHDTLRTTLAAVGFTRSTADPSQFLRTDTSLPPFYVLVYVDDLVFATADTDPYHPGQSTAHHHPDTVTHGAPGPSTLRLPVLLATAHSSVYQPLALSSTFGRVHASWVDDLAKQWSSQGYTFSLGSGFVSWRSTCSSSVLSSSCEAQIYTRAMAAQELRWLTYLVTDLGEQPRSPPQRGQLHLAYVVTRANTADIFTKALQSGDHQRFSTVLGLFDTWLDDLQLYLLSDIEDSVSLFDHVSGAATAPPATADSSTRSQWLSRNAAARLAIRNHLLLAECAHFGKHRTAQALYDAEVARYSSPATAALGRLLMPYLFPELSAFATVKDLVSHLRASDAPSRAAAPAQFHDRNKPPMFITLYFIVTRLPDSLCSVRDHFLSLDPTSLTVDLLEQHLLTAETSAVACRSRKGKGGRGGGGSSGGGEGGSGSGGGGSSGGGGGGGTGGGCGGSGGGGGGSGGSGSSGGGGTGVGGTGAWRVGSGGGQRQQQQCRSKTQSPQQLLIRTGDRAGQTCGRLHTQHRCFSCLDDAWRAEFGDDADLPRWADLLRSRIAIFDLEFDAIHSAMYALSVSAEGDCYRCAPPDPGIAAASLGASESRTLPGSSPAQALHNFTLDSGASRCFFRDSTTLTPLPALVTVRLADPSWGPVVARSSTILLCPAVPSGSLSGLHLPSFSMNLTLLWHHRLGHPSLPRLCGMHSRLLVFGLPRSLPPLPPTTAPPCLPCVEGRQRAAPLSSSFPPMTSPLQTLHMDLWSPARVSGKGRERYFLLVVDDYTRYTTVFPLRSKGEVSDVLIPWICTVRLQLHERFGQDLPVLHLHADRGGELSFDLLREFCRGEGILQSFTLPDSPQQNVIDERRIGLVMEVARTSMIHAAAPHFLWPFAVRYAAHQLNLWPSVSLPETSPTLRWTGKVGDALVFRVWGSRAFARDTSADKLSARAIPYIFLSFVLDVPGWQFYHPTSRRVFPSQDATFDEPVPSQGPAPSCVSQVDPLPSTALVQVVVGSGATPGTASGGAASGSAEPGVAESEGAGSGGAGPGAEEPGGAEPAGVETRGIEPGGAESEGAESGGAEPRGAASSGGPAGASSRLSPQQLPWGGGVTVGASGAGAAASCPGGARTRGTGAAWAGGVEGAGAGDPTEPGATRAGGSGTGAGGARAAGAGAVDPGAGGAGDTVRSRPYFVPLLQQVLGVPSSTSLTPPLLYPPHDQSQLPLQPASPPPAPSLYTQQSGGLTERRKPASRPVSPVRTTCCAPRSRPPPVLGKHAMVSRASSVPMRVPLPAHAASPTVSGLLATAVTDPSFERQEDFEGLAAALPRFVSILLAPEGDPDAPDIPTPRSYAEAITSPYSSQWQATMDAEMASWKSTGTYVDEVPPPGTNIVDGMWIFRGSLHEEIWLRRPPGFTGLFPAVLVNVDDLVFATVDTKAQTLVKSELQKRHTCTYLGELRSYLGLQITRDRARRTITLTQSHMVHQVLQRFGFHFSSPQPTPLSTSHSLSAPPLDKSSGLYPELVGCLIYLMTCTRPDLTYPLSLMARYVAPGRHRKVHWDAAKRVLCYLCSTLGMGLVLGGRGPFVLTGHEYAFWVDDSATQRSSRGYTFSLGSGPISWRSTCSSSVLNSSCEAEIYTGAMAAQELRWLTYLHDPCSCSSFSVTVCGPVGDASVFRVRGSLDFVRDTSADKLSPRAIPCVFLGFVPDAPGWQFYHPTSRRDFPSQDVMLVESVPFYRVSQVDPLLGPAPVQVAVDSRAARGAVSGGVASGGAEPGGARSEGAGSGGAEPGGVEIGGAELGGVATGGVEPGGAELEGVEPGGAASEGAASGDAEPQGATSSGGSACSSPSLSLQQLREWFVRRGASRAGGSGPAGAGGTGVAGGAGVTGGTAITGPGGARTWGTVAAGTGGVEGAGAGDLKESGTTGAGGAGAGGAGVGGPGAGGAGVGSPGVGGAGDGGAGAVDPGGAVRPRPYFVPLLQQVLGTPPNAALTPPLLCPPLDQSQPPLQPASPLPAPSPYTEQSDGLSERREPASRPISPVRTAHHVPRSRPPPVPGTHAMTLRPSSVPLRIPLPAPPQSSLLEVPDPESDRARAAHPAVSRLLATAFNDPSFESAAASALVAELLDFAAACRLDYATTLVAESASASPPSVRGECALGTDVLEDRQQDFECLAAAVPRFASMLLAPEGDPDAPDIPTLCSYAEAITSPYSS
ncbi:unnamed protein product [Closterium sp. NIES-53]